MRRSSRRVVFQKRIRPERAVRRVPDAPRAAGQVELPGTVGPVPRQRDSFLRDCFCVFQIVPLERAAVRAGLQVEPVHVAVGDADDGEVAARRDGDGAHRALVVHDPVGPHSRGRHEDVLAQDAVFQAPRVRARLAHVAGHDVRPVALARLAPRHGRHRGQLQLRLGDFQALGAALDVRLRQLQRLLVLDRGEDAQRAVVPARAQEPRALLAVKLDVLRRRGVPGAEAQQTAAPVAVVEDPVLQRVVSARGHQDRGPGEEVARDTRGVVRAHHQRPQAPLLQVPHRNRAAVADGGEQRLAPPGAEGHVAHRFATAVVPEDGDGRVQPDVVHANRPVREPDRDGVQRGRVRQARHGDAS